MQRPPGEGSPEKMLSTSETFMRPVGSAEKHLTAEARGQLHGKKRRRVKKRRAQLKPIYKSKTWIAGFALFKISNWTNFAAYGFGSQSVLSALASVQFVSNLVFGAAFLGEKPTGRMVAGTMLIVCGILFVILFSNTSSNQDYVMDDLLELYRSPVYIVYISLLSAIGAGAYCAYQRFSKAGQQIGPGGIKLPDPIAKPLCFSLYSAIIGTQSVTFSKMFVELIRSNFSRYRPGLPAPGGLRPHLGLPPGAHCLRDLLGQAAELRPPRVRRAGDRAHDAGVLDDAHDHQRRGVLSRVSADDSQGGHHVRGGGGGGPRGHDVGGSADEGGR